MEKTSLSPQNNAPEKPREEFWKELGKLILFALVIVVPFRLYIAQPFVVEGASMDPTFETGDYLIVDELSYHFKSPKRGEVLVFKYPKDPKKHFIKRVIGLPGETVSLNHGKVTIINSEHPNGLVLEEPYVKFLKRDTLSFVVGQDEYFVMGDNRAASADSRFWGGVPKENIIGRPILRFLPPALLPGHVEFDSEESNRNQ